MTPGRWCAYLCLRVVTRAVLGGEGKGVQQCWGSYSMPAAQGAGLGIGVHSGRTCDPWRRMRKWRRPIPPHPHHDTFHCHRQAAAAQHNVG